MTDIPLPTRRARRRLRRGERGLSIAMTALVLIPLMVFSALGVDLAAWYTRAGELQRAADAAALAGAPWMPNQARATTEAAATLRANGFVHGVDGIEVVIERGSTATSLRVTLTDTQVDQYFSQVVRGAPVLTRSAEAEYHLPLPLGSPLNYFGGTASQTKRPDTVTHTVVWPINYQTVAPALNARQSCNVGGDGQNLGRWTANNANPPTYTFNANAENSGSTRCTWPAQNPTNGSPGCNHQQGTGPNGTGGSPGAGRWYASSSTLHQWTARFDSGTANRQCTWNAAAVGTFPPGYNTTANRPATRPCNVGNTHQWQSGTPAAPVTGTTISNRQCLWPATIDTTVTPGENPIPEDRSPNFWAFVLGPGNIAGNGDPYSTRCRTNVNCGNATPTNLEYNGNDATRGFWYVVDVPTGGPIDVNVFDASLNFSNDSTNFVDFSENQGGESNASFRTTYTVYETQNRLDPLSNPTPVSGCSLSVRDEAAYHERWHTICTLSAANGSQYLINVRTDAVSGANNAGSNRYAIEVVLGGDRYNPNSPNIYAYAAMAVYNRLDAGSTGGTQVGSFYLAKVGPEHAGKTLVITLYDAGDSVNGGSGRYARIFPTRPRAGTGLERIPASSLADCAWTSSPAPNQVINSSGSITGGGVADTGGNKLPNDRLQSGVRLESSPRPSDGGTFCRIDSNIGGTRQFNGVWLEIRVRIPSDYTCDPGINPNVSPQLAPGGSCWWGIEYEFNGTDASDETTWRARIEGNPLQLIN